MAPGETVGTPRPRTGGYGLGAVETVLSVDDVARGAAELAAEAAQPRSDERGSADYKRSVVRVFTERGLRKAAETAQAA